MKKLLTITALLTLASCQQYSMTAGGVSYHFNHEYHGRNYNEVHNNIGLGGENSYGDHNFGATAQFVKNSFDNDSIYATGYYTYTNVRYKNFTNASGVLGGAASGYGDRFGRKGQNIIPVAGLYNEACLSKYCLYQVVMPPFDGMSGVGIMGGKYKF